MADDFDDSPQDYKPPMRKSIDQIMSVHGVSGYFVDGQDSLSLRIHLVIDRSRKQASLIVLTLDNSKDG